MRRALAAIVFAIVASPALADPCSKPDVERTGAAVEAARTAILDSLPKRDLDPRIPSRSRKAIAAMQHRLHAYLAAALGCSADAKALEKTLRWSTPGLRFEARSPREGLMAVTAGFDVGCGGDTVLAIFARRDGGWRDVLYAHSKPYKEVSGAWGAFDYAVSAPDEGGQWFVAAKTVAPWCSSTWSTIRYSVLRPGAAAAIFAAEDSIWWGNDDFGRLKAGRDDFELRFHAESIDGGVHNREWVRHFAVRGDKVARIAPFADTPRDFVEEWIQSSWQGRSGLDGARARAASEGGACALPCRAAWRIPVDPALRRGCRADRDPAHRRRRKPVLRGLGQPRLRPHRPVEHGRSALRGQGPLRSGQARLAPIGARARARRALAWVGVSAKHARPFERGLP